MSSIWNELQGLEFSQKYYMAGGVRMRSIEAGSGHPLIFLHGTGGHAEAYMRNIKPHAEHFKVYAVDLVGHGYSESADLDYGMQVYVDNLRDFMDAAGIEKAHLSGESLGGSICVWFALQYPERVSKICLNTGIPVAPGPEGQAQLQALLDRSRAAASGAPTMETIRARVAWLMADEKSITDEIVESRYRIYTQEGRPPILKTISEQAILGLLEPANRETWNNPENLSKLHCPVLLVWTAHNPGQPVQLAEECSKLIKDCEMHVLQHSGHWPQWEEADEFNKIHIEFMAR